LALPLRGIGENLIGRPRLYSPGSCGSSSIASSSFKRKPLPFQSPLKREAGVLLHVTSLPGPFGIGDLGPVAHAWIDQLAAAGQSWWQILPLGPPAAGNSPYNCYSAFAGNPLLISPEALVADGLLDRADLKPLPGRTDRINFDKVAASKARSLRLAWTNYREGDGGTLRAAFAAFRSGASGWLEDYSLFAALHSANGNKPWFQWSSALVCREPRAMETAHETLADEIAFQQFQQFLFYRQLAALRRRASEKEVGILGDLPIFVALDSADVWGNPSGFQLDRLRRPKAVSGVPPDAFSADGQRWNNPLYDWAAMEADGYAWWIDRMTTTLGQCDAVRLDHFRGFDAYWRIPASAATARTGKWVPGPGMKLFDAFKEAFGVLPLVAEDLGLITPSVEKLRLDLGLPSMRVLQFGLCDAGDSTHKPHHIGRDCVAYSGTHDNDTTVGWYRSLSDAEKRRVARYAACEGRLKEPSWTLIRLAWASTAALAIAPLQDLLALPSKARMNKPGVAHGNWRWRANDPAGIERGLKRLADLTAIYARSP